MSDGLQILLVDDEPVVLQTLGDYLRALGHDVDTAKDGQTGLEKIRQRIHDLAIVDVRMPGIDGIELLRRVREARLEIAVILITGHGTLQTAVDALRLGATDFLTKPVRLTELEAVLERTARVLALERERERLRNTIGAFQESQQELDGTGDPGAIVGASPSTGQVRELVRRAAESDCEAILITGETGTGKEVVAREIHRLGSGNKHPFIAVSSPALSESLAESEIFGHVKGSFTGASADRIGCFEMADGGTLFLDEIGDLPLGVQAKLLRVLETRLFRRVGGQKEVQVDFRLIAATNVDLDQAVEDGRFRPDLLYRLNVFTIHLLPLRERRADILPLARHFLHTISARRRIQASDFAPEAQRQLENYDYPGNARELRNLIERAIILAGGKPRIEAGHLSLSTFSAPSPAPPKAPAARGEREAILQALEQCRWNRKKAAELLGMPYSTLRYKIDKLQLH